jgi:hypothetical protein
VNEPVSTMAMKERSWSVSSMIDLDSLWIIEKTFIGPIGRSLAR